MKQILYTLIVLWIASCSSGPNDSNHDLNALQIATSTEELADTGLLTHIEEGAYPMFTITMEFSDRKLVQQFNLNMQEIDLDVEELNALLNKYVSIEYKSELLPILIDLQLRGASILGEEVADIKNKKSITGILSDAESPAGGDLPSSFSMTREDGAIMKFQYFIPREMTEGNGKEVTAYYEYESRNTLTGLTKVNNDYEAKVCRTSSSTIEDIPEYDMPFENVSFLIIQSTKDYYVALATAKKVSKLLGIEVKLNGTYEKGKGLVYTEECGCGIIHDYIPRGRFDDGNFVSIEQTDSYKEFTNGYFIVVAGSGDRKNLTPLLKKVKASFKDAYIKEAEVYVGCMH